MANLITVQTKEIMGPGFLIFFLANDRMVEAVIQLSSGGAEASSVFSSRPAATQGYAAGSTANQEYHAGA